MQTGSAAALVTTKEAHEINQPTIENVEKFVPNATGEKFGPHVPIGLAKEDYLKQMLAENFEQFTFSPVGVTRLQAQEFPHSSHETQELPVQALRFHRGEG